MRSSRISIWAVFVVAALSLCLPAYAQGPFSLLSPADGAAGVFPTATLSWEPSAGAVSYVVHIGATNPPSAGNDQTVASTSFMPLQSALGLLATSTTYYWSVTAIAGDGTLRLNDGGIQSFTTSPFPHAPHPLYTPPDSFPTPPFPQAAGPWSAPNQPPVSVSNCLLLTDGRVVCQRVGTRNWYSLTPDINGSYFNGTWAAIGLTPPGYAPLYESSAVLPDGRIIVMGGEYECSSGNCNPIWQTNGAIYDPRTNAWTHQAAPSGWSKIGDAMAIVLPDGTYMQSNCCTSQSAILNPSTLAWTSVPGAPLDGDNDEEGWVLLPDGTVLKVDVWSATKNQTERFNPATGLWTSAGLTPSVLPDNITHTNGTGLSFELGPGLLRPDGTVFWIGTAGEPTATGHTAIYNTTTNTWSAGPDIPSHDGGNDAPAAVLPNGNVLAQLGPASASNVFGSPSHFYEFDGTNLNLVALPTNCVSTCNFPSFVGTMLVLPTGQVLLAEQSGHVELYTSPGSASAAWLPTITSVPGTVNRGSTNTISGTQFNGLGVGSAYGDDVQSATNYPLVRITNRATGHVFYAKTHNHSTMAVATGSATVSTQFDVPVNTETGSSDIEVVANGIASAKTPITISSVSPPPAVTINQAAAQADPSTSAPFNFTAVFSEGVTGFTGSQVTITGTAPGTLSALVTGGPSVYNVAVSGMTGPGTVIVNIAAGVTTGIVSGLVNLVSTSTDNIVTFGTPPTVTINQAVGQADPSNANPFNYTVVFSEAISGFTAAAVQLTGTVTGSIQTTVTGGPTTFNVAVSGITGAGTLSVSVPANVAVSVLSGLGNLASTSTDNTVTFTTSPTVKINQAAAQADPTSTSPINFTVVFTQSMTGFSNSGVTLSGTAGATTALVTGSGTTYNVAVSGMTASGTVIATVNAGAATGTVSGLANLGSFSTDHTVTFTGAVKKVRGQLTTF